MSNTRCGYALVDEDGEQYPCDRPALSWRWYQDVEHEDSLDYACELHENEGGRRMSNLLLRLGIERARADAAEAKLTSVGYVEGHVPAMCPTCEENPAAIQPRRNDLYRRSADA